MLRAFSLTRCCEGPVLCYDDDPYGEQGDGSGNRPHRQPLRDTGRQMRKQVESMSGKQALLRDDKALRARNFSRFARGVLLAWLLGPVAQASEPTPITLDQAFATPSLTGVVPSNPAWSPDSRRFAFAWNDRGEPKRALWIASKDGKDLERLDARAETGSVRDIAWLPDGDTILTLRGDALWATDARRGRTSKIAELGPGASNLSVSPDGSMAAYLKDGDLWLVDVDGGTPVAVTEIGMPSLSSLPIGRYSRPEREIGPGIWGGPTYRWSPDGKTIAVHYVDRRGMRKVPFPDYLADETDPNEVRRGYPGDPNELRTVGLVDVERRELELLALDDPTANQVVDFSWSDDGVLLLDLATDTAVDRWLATLPVSPAASASFS